MVYNRLNIFQLFEQSINFITNRTVQYFKDNPKLTLANKEKILFRILEILAPQQEAKIHPKYKSSTKKEKEYFFEVVYKHGIQVNVLPFWHPVNLYDAIQQVYKEFDFIKPYNVYIYEETSQRWVKQMRQQVVGQLYIMKLKQSSKKQLSACSYAPIGRTGVPEKTDSAKKHKTLVAPTPIKKGIQEGINTMISIRPETYAKEHMYYRSSPVARRELGNEIIDNFGIGKPIEPISTDKMTARDVEKLQAYLTIMGTELEYTQDELYLPQFFEDGEGYEDKMFTHKLFGDTYIATPQHMIREYAKKRVRERMENNEIGYMYIGNEGRVKDDFIEELTDIVASEILDEGIDFFKHEDALL